MSEPLTAKASLRCPSFYRHSPARCRPEPQSLMPSTKQPHPSTLYYFPVEHCLNSHIALLFFFGHSYFLLSLWSCLPGSGLCLNVFLTHVENLFFLSTIVPAPKQKPTTCLLQGIFSQWHCPSMKAWHYISHWRSHAYAYDCFASFLTFQSSQV